MARKSGATLRTPQRAAQEVAARVNAQMGEKLVMFGSDPRFQIQKITTGSLALDRLLRGGISRGRHTVIYGDWQVGKSLLVYMTLIEAQRRGEVAAIVDGEGIFDEAWFIALGGDAEALLKYRPRTANQLAKVLQLFVQHDEEVAAVDVVGIDSVASMLPEEELEHDFEEGDARVASLARLMSMLLRRVTSQNDKTAFIWTNQWRDKISRIPGLQSTPGGRSLGFYASTMIELKKTEAETMDREMVHKAQFTNRKVKIGQWVLVTLKKEKTGGVPESSVSLMLDHELGQYDRGREIIDLGMEDGLIARPNKTMFQIVADGFPTKKYNGVKQLASAIMDDDQIRYDLEALIEAKTELLAEGESG